MKSVDGVCRLLGYERSELLDMSIDDVSASSTADVDSLWEDYRNSGHLEGQHTLKTSSGAHIRILYRSRVFPDGGMVAAWQPL